MKGRLSVWVADMKKHLSKAYGETVSLLQICRQFIETTPIRPHLDIAGDSLRKV